MIALLIACGTPTTQPVQPVLMEDDGYEPPPRATLAADAAIPDAPIDAEVVAAPADAAVSQADSGTDGVTYEDGIPVYRSKMRPWCATDTGFCADTQAKCSKLGKGCRRVTNYACFKALMRTSGKWIVGCFATYSLCDEVGDRGAESPETAEVSPCAIFRYDPKAKE